MNCFSYLRVHKQTCHLMKKLHFIVLSCLILLLASCDVSSISDEKLNKISNIKANIYMKYDLISGERNNLLVYITDGDKQIINPNLKVYVNDSLMSLSVRQDMYYTKKSWYAIDDLPDAESYYFQIVTPDSIKHALAFIKPSALPENLHFDLPKTHISSKNFTLYWEHILTPSTLRIWQETAEYGEGKIMEDITETTGNYTIPQTYFRKDSTRLISYFNVRLNHRETGLVNPKLMQGSDILCNFKIEQDIDIEE